MCQKDMKHHDFTAEIDAGTGLTIHVNNDFLDIAKNRLKRHCEQRKYKQKADNWFGICIDPNDISIRFGLELDYQWVKSDEMEKITKDILSLKKKIDLRTKVRSSRKIGRNELCPCTSGKKYKKCCLNI